MNSSLARLSALPLLVSAALLTGAAAPTPADDPSLDSLIAAERGFAKTSAETDTKTAFVTHLADDAVIFQPGPINGLRAWRARAPRPALLQWSPDFAEVSGAGDLGFTSGPWAWSPRRDAEPTVFGTFVTVWKKQRDGEWKVALDSGVSHPGTRADLDREVTRGPFHPRPDSTLWRKWDADVGVGVSSGHVGVGIGTGGFGVGLHSGGVGFGLGTAGIRSRQDYEWRRTAHEKNLMMNEERRLAFEARTHGWERAYRAVAGNDLRFDREGRAPDLGIDAAVEGSAGLPRDRDYQPLGNGVAASWDLGYDYGIVITPVKHARPDTSSWVHLWRKDDAGAWRLLVDVETPFPKPQK